MTDIATLLHKPDTTIALVGATDNPAQYGHVIFHDFVRKGYLANAGIVVESRLKP